MTDTNSWNNNLVAAFKIKREEKKKLSVNQNLNINQNQTPKKIIIRH